MKSGMRVLGLCLLLLLIGPSAWNEEAPAPSVLYVASERHTSLALNYAYFPQFARLGFGTLEAPWHPWFGTRELKALLHLPGYDLGQAVEISPRIMIGARFGGKTWQSGFEALRQFDTDQNGVVESDELNDLYVWTDADRSGTFEVGIGPGQKDTLVACRQLYAGFDLRRAPVRKNGYAREELLAPFTVFRSHTTRIHLLELPIRGAFTDRFRAYLSFAEMKDFDPEHAFSGEWHWEITGGGDGQNQPATWARHQSRPSGRLLLAASGREIRGLVQYEGRYADTINLPLKGVVMDQQAEWQSVSPLGLTRSVVRLSQEFGRPVLLGAGMGDAQWETPKMAVESLSCTTD